MDVDRTRQTAASGRKCSQKWLAIDGALTCEPHLEGNPSMSWLLAALLTMFVGAPAPDCMLVEFTTDNCGPCRQLQPALEKLKNAGWDIQTVNVKQEPALVKKHAIDSLPTLLLISNGKEVDRIVGAAPYDMILPRLARLLLVTKSNSGNPNFGNPTPKVDAPQILTPKLIESAPNQLGRTAPAAAAENWQTSQPNQLNRLSPDSGITVRGQSPVGAFPMLAATTNSVIAAAPSSQAIAEQFERLGSPAGSPSIRLASDSSPIRPVEPSVTHSSQPERMLNQRTHHQLAKSAAPIDLEKAIARAEAATVRIRVDEENSTAYGTGTVIDVHGDEALVLTCGHLFREMKLHSQLTIDLFAGRSQPMNIPAQLIDFKADAGDVDIGLISFKLPLAIEPVPLLPQSERLSVRQPAFSFGCDHGQNPTRRDTQVKSVNRYMGAPNVEDA
jgi:thiol-disulfide isomerase/thioredoxin